MFPLCLVGWQGPWPQPVPAPSSGPCSALGFADMKVGAASHRLLGSAPAAPETPQWRPDAGAPAAAPTAPSQPGL